MKAKQILGILPALVKYNMKIIFAGKFFWFILASFAFYALLLVMGVLNPNTVIDEAFVYAQLLVPGILLVFYPSVFGIQNDEDSKILEIIFGIPNYRYKVWFLRLVMIYIAVGLILLLFATVANYMVYPVNPFEIVVRLMLPVVFVGNLAFMLSTLTRNGNSTAVLVILIAVAFIIMHSGNIFDIKNSMFNIALNPFDLPENVHPVIRSGLVFRNTAFLLIGALAWLMIGLQNLTKREKFV